MALFLQADGTVLISSRSRWLPGVYESLQAALMAFRCDEATLRALQDAANVRAGGSGGIISLTDLQGRHNHGQQASAQTPRVRRETGTE